MPPKHNPLGLNPLQLKTLTILQQMARSPGHAEPAEPDGAIKVGNWPPAHGDHFHIGDAVILGRDATGLNNPAVFVALERKGLVRAADGEHALVTAEGMAYPTGLDGQILHRHAH